MGCESVKDKQGSKLTIEITMKSKQNVKVNRGDTKGEGTDNSVISKIIQANDKYSFLTPEEVERVKQLFEIHKLGGKTTKVKAYLMFSAFWRLMQERPELWNSFQSSKKELLEKVIAQHIPWLTEKYRSYLKKFTWLKNSDTAIFKAKNSTLLKWRRDIVGNSYLSNNSTK